MAKQKKKSTRSDQPSTAVKPAPPPRKRAASDTARTEPAGVATAAPSRQAAPPDVDLITDDDLHYFNEGAHRTLFRCLGAHPVTTAGKSGVHFAVWAPGAKGVSVIGDFNGWNKTANPLHPKGSSGVWRGFIEGVQPGAVYKYLVRSADAGKEFEKADPLAFAAEEPPKTGSVVAEQSYDWGDGDWMQAREKTQALGAPMSIYELHLGSWRRSPDDPDKFLSYRDLAPMLADYVKDLGFTHVEFLPLMEHPFYGSWGYQTTGYFAPSSRYGSPQDFAYLVDYLHQNGVGVILDWVPSHFPTDGHSLAYFDGTHLYEHSDDRLGFHPDWKSYIFNYGRHEVRSFLLSSAVYWLKHFHADGLRVDAVASMLYRDYSRKEGEWIPNEFGGRENLEAIQFLRQMNEAAYVETPGTQTVAEESTSWPMVSRPTYVGGLGFGYKWDMGWMHDTLSYMSRDPVHRSYHHNEITFRSIYAFSENFVLPISHDEVVHGKGSLLGKMPGDDWQKFANLRLLLSYMWSQPGKKLLFMGCEFGQSAEWKHDHSLDWHLLDHESHKGVQNIVRDLNRLYRAEPALHEYDCDPRGYEWIDGSDTHNSVLAYLRKGATPESEIVVVCNFTPAVHSNYRIGVNGPGYWKELFNSDAEHYWGSGQGNMGGADATPVRHHGRSHSINVVLPPLSLVMFKRERTE